MYQAHYINPLFQFGKKTYELVITDDAGVLPTERQWMDFDETITDQEMIVRAETFIDAVLARQAEQQVIE